MDRTTVGAIALVLLAGAISLTLFAGDESEAWRSACVRIGLVMGALWLALPQLERIPNWALKGALLFFMALACIGGKIRVVAMAVVVYIAVAWLLPKLGVGNKAPATARRRG